MIRRGKASKAMRGVKKVLVIDVGGTNVKFLVTGHKYARRFASGPKLTPQRMVDKVKEHAADWKYDVITIGYPGIVRRGRVASEPRNLGPGWAEFDFEAAFKRPVKLINDAAMQALGSYRGGLMFFVGLGTGLGSALIADGVVVPMELGHLSYRRGTYEGYMGLRAFKLLGKPKWRRHVAQATRRLMAAIHPDEVVVGGGLAIELGKLPEGCRAGDNAHAFLGGTRLWEEMNQTRRRGNRARGHLCRYRAEAQRFNHQKKRRLEHSRKENEYEQKSYSIPHSNRPF
jgi:polyphosphate glucokinase